MDVDSVRASAGVRTNDLNAECSLWRSGAGGCADADVAPALLFDIFAPIVAGGGVRGPPSRREQSTREKQPDQRSGTDQRWVGAIKETVRRRGKRRGRAVAVVAVADCEGRLGGRLAERTRSGSLVLR